MHTVQCIHLFCNFAVHVMIRRERDVKVCMFSFILMTYYRETHTDKLCCKGVP